MNEKVWKIGCLWILVSSTSMKVFLLEAGFLLSSLTMTGVAKAACTPKPDCASIGYTETSCEGEFVRCPFDISKLLCLPCDSKYQYDCSGANITGGVGTSCAGKYVFCSCSGEGTFNNGECPQQNCTVGMIYYSDKSCSEDVDASKTAIGIVVKDNELIVALNVPDMSWSYDYIDVSGITNYTSSSDAKKDYNGKANTLAIVSAYSGESASENAAILCNSYSTAGTSTGDWYLPAAGELYSYIYGNYSTINSTMSALGWTFGSRYFWSSSVFSNYYAWYVSSGNDIVNYYNKNGNYGSVSCLLDINQY